MKHQIFILAAILWLLLGATSTCAEQCGRQAGGALCPDSLCCSEHGWCGNTTEYCGTNCQSQCAPSTPTTPTVTPTPSGGSNGGVDTVISSALFDELLKHRNSPNCEGNGFYKYEAFIAAARSFNGFGTTGDADVRKKEVAAFLAQTSHETTGGGPQSEDGPYAWGYCFVTEQNNPGDYCNASNIDWPCAPGKKYYGRGPIQLTHNYNYGPAGKAIEVDLLGDPDLVATNAEISFKTAMWFWMTRQWNKPSSHDVITGRWTPSDADRSANRVPGYGVITNIINGGIECGKGPNDKVADRIGFYKRYCGILGVSDESNLDCYNQSPFS